MRNETDFMPPTASKASPVIPLLHSRWRNFLSGLCTLGLRLSISLLSYSPPPWPTMPSLHLSFVMLPSNFTKTISGEQFRLSSIIFGSIRRTTSSSLRVCQPPLLTHTMISFTKSAKSLFLFGAPGAFFFLFTIGRWFAEAFFTVAFRIWLALSLFSLLVESGCQLLILSCNSPLGSKKTPKERYKKALATGRVHKTHL